MKYIITENKMEKVILHFLNEKYGDLEKYEPDKYRTTILYIRGKNIYMEQSKNLDTLLVDVRIWADLEEWFSLDRVRFQSIISKWIKECYNLDFAPRSIILFPLKTI